MPTSEGHKPSSNNEKGSNDRPSSIGACNTAITPHNINPQTRPTLLYSTHQIAPNHLTTDSMHQIRACAGTWTRAQQLVCGATGQSDFDHRLKSITGDRGVAPVGRHSALRVGVRQN